RCNVISLKYHLKTFTAMKRTIRNWSEYNAGLKQRGSLTFWVDGAVLTAWYNRERSGKPGASKELLLQCVALNHMIQIAKPDSICVEA
ncbi:MAG: hypothetical protein VKJ24_04630, partial [Synechococcales bacterium]|nr:hypothetical protein [Synechococcales bacterium]